MERPISTGEANNIAVGVGTKVILNGTGTHTGSTDGEVASIQVHTDCTFTATYSNGTVLPSALLSANSVRSGPFSSVEITDSGILILLLSGV